MKITRYDYDRLMDVFDYNIYGCPKGMDVRIGDFTQSKLEVN